MDDDLQITIEYLPLTGDDVSAMIYLEIADPPKAHETKLRLLAKMGITPQGDELPQQAWLRYLSELNGLEFTTPCHRAIAEGITEIHAAACTMWVLTETKSDREGGKT